MGSSRTLLLRTCGGGGIPAYRSPPAALTVALVGIPALTAAALYPILLPGPARRIVIILAVMGASGVVFGVAIRWSRAVAWSLAILVVAYGVALAGRDRIDPYAPLFATAVLLAGEAAFTALESAPGTPLRAGASWAGRVAGLAVVGIVTGGVVLAVAAVPLPHGPLIQVVGVGVAAASLAGVAALVRRRT